MVAGSMSDSMLHYAAQRRHLLDRRGFLGHAATSLGGVALASLLGRDGLLAGGGLPVIDPARPYAPRRPHGVAKARQVVVIFCAGAVSQLETWDYKPELIRHDGKPMPGGPAVTFQGPAGELCPFGKRALRACRLSFRR